MKQDDLIIDSSNSTFNYFNEIVLPIKTANCNQYIVSGSYKL